MADRRLIVDPADLLRSAEAHDQRAHGWRQIGATPPHDPDQLAHDLGFVGHAFTEAMRARNAERARDAEKIAAGFEKDANALRDGARDYLGTDERHAQAMDQVHADASGPDGTGRGPNGVGRIDDFQSGGMNGPYDTNAAPPDGQVRAQMPANVPPDAPIGHTPPPVVAQMPPGVGPDAPLAEPGTATGGLTGGVSGPFDVQGSGPAQVRPAGYTEPMDPSAGDYDRLYPKLFPNPLPGQPGGGTWADVAPSAGDATHPPHGGLIPNKSALPGEYTPNSRGPEFTEVWPNAQGGYDIMAPGIDPTPSTRTDGAR